MGLLRQLLGGVFGGSAKAPNSPLLSQPGKTGGQSQGGAKSSKPGAEPRQDGVAQARALIDADHCDEALAAAIALPAAADPDELSALAEGFLQAGSPDHARRLLAHLLQLHAESAPLHERLALVALAQDDQATARAAAARALQIDPKRRWAHVVEAEVLLREGHFEEAEAEYQALAATGNDWLMCRNVHFGGAFFKSLSGKIPEVPAPTVVVAAGNAAFDHVLLVSCDRAYFEEYGGAFVNAYARNGGGRGLLHLHVVDPAPDFAEKIARLIEKTGIAAIAVTTEKTPFRKLSPAKQKTYYTCARFLHFGNWLAQYRKPIVCFDVDAIVEKPLDPLVEACRDADLGLVWREPRRAVWLDVVAYTVFANPTPAAIEYFRLVRRFLLVFAAKGFLYWQIDQIALHCVLIMLRRFAKAPRTVDIFGHIDEVAWLLARRRTGGKTGDPVYLAYRAEY